MQIVNSTRVGSAEGSVDLFSDFEEGGDMWTGEGSRVRSQQVTFDHPFSAPPAVHVSLTSQPLGVMRCLEHGKTHALHAFGFLGWQWAA